MDEGTISGGAVIWNLDANQVPLDASLVEAQGKVEAYAAAVDAANKTVGASAQTVSDSVVIADAKTVAASGDMSAGIAADDEAVISRNAATIASFNALGASLEDKVGISKTLGIGAAVVAAGIAIAAGVMVKAAGDFQKSVTQIYSSAGETAPLKTIDDGILQIARDTGTTTQELVNGLYTISSAGFNTASGLIVLRAAAEGAKAENADLATVTNALTTVLHDYHEGTGQATSVTNQMIAAVSAGKLHLQDFAASLSTVLPIADQVGLSFAQVAGAEATLTAGGVSAQQATQDLHSLIAALIAPTQQQTTAMLQMGLNATTVAQQLGTKGLTGTLQELFDAITQHMGPSGLVLQSAMKNATLATQDLNKEVAASPAQLKSLEQALLNGTISFTDYRTQVRALPEALTNLGAQFESTYNQAHSFNSQLVAGINSSPTFAAQLKAMTGQTDAMNAVMLLTGQNFGTFQKNVTDVANAAHTAGNNISSWGEIQQNFNQQMSELKEDLTTTGIAIGTALLPPLTKFAHTLADSLGDVANFVSKNKTLVTALFITTGALSSVVAITYGATKAMAGLRTTTELLGTGSLASGAKLNIMQEALVATRSAALGVTGSFTSLWAVINGESLEADAVNPIFAIITALSLLALGIYEVINHWNTVKDWMASFWDRWKADIIGFMLFFAPEMLILGGIADILIRNWTPIKDFFTHLWDDVTKVTDIFVDGFTRHLAPLEAKAAPYWDAIRKDAFDAWTGINQDAQTAFTKLHDDLVTVLNRMIRDLNPQWAGFKVEAKSAFEDMRHAVGSSMNSTVSDLLTAAGKLHQDLLPYYVGFKNDVVSVWDDLRVQSVSEFEKLKTSLTPILSKLGADVRGALGDIARSPSTITNDLSNGTLLKSLEQKGTQWGTALVTGYKKGLHDLISYDIASVINWGKQAKEFLTEGTTFASSFVSGIGTGLTANVHSIGQFFTNIPGLIATQLHESGQAAADEHIKGFASSFTDIGKMNKLGSEILNGIQEAILAVLLGIGVLAASIVVALINGMISVMRSTAHLLAQGLTALEGVIIDYFSDASSWLIDAGKAIINGLASGIESQVEAPISAVKKVLGAVSKLLPHSPAEEGPLSGRGWTLYSGMAISDALAQGIKSSGGQAVTAMSSVMGGIASVSGVGPAAGVGTELSDSTADSIVNGLASGSTGAAGAQTVHVHLHASGIVATSRSQWREIVKDGLAAVDEELKSKNYPTLLPRGVYGRSTAA